MNNWRRNRTAANRFVLMAAAYLARHPYCQIFIARHELDEDAVICGGGKSGSIKVPRATLVHQRTDGLGASIDGDAWWMAACTEELAWVRKNKDVATALGFVVEDNDVNLFRTRGPDLVPVRGLPTPQFMAKKTRRL